METRSLVSTDGGIIYVDKRIGMNGERGPYQMLEETYNWIKSPLWPGFKHLSTDMVLARAAFRRYVRRIYTGNWINTLHRYNLHNTYPQRVYEAGTKR